MFNCAVFLFFRIEYLFLSSTQYCFSYLAFFSSPITDERLVYTDVYNCIYIYIYVQIVIILGVKLIEALVVLYFMSVIILYKIM